MDVGEVAVKSAKEGCYVSRKRMTRRDLEFGNGCREAGQQRDQKVPVIIRDIVSATSTSLLSNIYFRPVSTVQAMGLRQGVEC